MTKRKREAEFGTMHVSIKTVKGKNINLEVQGGGSSNNINFKIHGEPIREVVLQLGEDNDEGVMSIFVKTLAGKTQTLNVKGSNTIQEVKAKLEEVDGTPVKQMKLLFQGRHLQDSETIDDYNIKHKSILIMMLHMCGC